MKTFLNKALTNFLALANDDAHIMIKAFNYRLEKQSDYKIAYEEIDREIARAERIHSRTARFAKGIYIALPFSVYILASLIFGVVKESAAPIYIAVFILSIFYISIYLITLPNYKLDELRKYINTLKETANTILKTKKAAKADEFKPLLKFKGSLTQLMLLGNLFAPFGKTNYVSYIRKNVANSNGEQYNYDSMKTIKSDLNNDYRTKDEALYELLNTLK